MSTSFCAQCGMSIEDFNDSGRLGCAECYNTFREALIPVFKHVHGFDRHTGKIPIADPRQLALRMELLDLRRALKEAVAGEAFEKAASLRDRINEIERDTEPRQMVQR